jgi:protein-tyrosine phosphatase
MEEIINNLYLGSFAEVQDIRSNISTGFSACLSVGSEFSLVKDYETQYHNYDRIGLTDLNLMGITHNILSIDDGSDDCICKILPTAFAFIDEHIEKGNVYVHCFAGISRSASIVYAYMLFKGWKPIPAFYHLTNKRGVVHPYNKFISEILNYFHEPNAKDIMKELKSGLYKKPGS